MRCSGVPPRMAMNCPSGEITAFWIAGNRPKAAAGGGPAGGVAGAGAWAWAWDAVERSRALVSAARPRLFIVNPHRAAINTPKMQL